MEPVFQAIIIVVIAAAAAATVYKTVPGMSLLLSMAAALLALFLCIGLLEPLAAFFRDAIAVSKLSGVYTGPLLKCMTISILTMIGESLCKDAGQAAGACAVQLVGVAAALYAALPLLDYTGKLILPGMTDLHVHAPQFAFRGLGMDMELLEWLNTYTFPEESKYKDLDYAERAYGSFASHLLRSTTTRAAIFATIHVPATELLMQKLDAMGLECFVGKVNMNRNSPVYQPEISTNHALRHTEPWIC